MSKIKVPHSTVKANYSADITTYHGNKGLIRRCYWCTL